MKRTKLIEDSDTKPTFWGTILGKWKNFGLVVLDPWVLILLIVTVLLNYFYLNQSIDQGISKSFQIILMVMISLLTGLLGGVASHKWSGFSETKILVARGANAIRSLKLILLNVDNISKRTKEYIKSTDINNSEHKLIINNFQEVIEKCAIVSEEIISSMENWMDIIPEIANLKTDIGTLSNLKNKESYLERQIIELEVAYQKESEAAKKASDDERNTVNESLSNLQNELKEIGINLKTVKQQVADTEYKLNSSGLGGISSYLGAPIQYVSWEEINKPNENQSYISMPIKSINDTLTSGTVFVYPPQKSTPPKT